MAVATSGKSAGTAFSGDESEATEAGTTEASDLRSAAAAEALLLDVVHRHADELLRVARAHSLCADDAHDAYQRSLEHFLRNGRRLRRETADRWLFTVVKREAGAVRRARSTLVASEDVDFDRLEARWDASPEDRALAADAVSRSAEALRSLKPQEVRALWLRADGRSYAQIQEATGWSYTKVNRCLTEGRRAFLARCAELEAGAECERWHGVLAAIAGGDARAEDLAALRPHLRHCAACKATLRALHASSASMGTVLPPGLVGAAAVEGHSGAERLEAAGRWLTRLYEAALGPIPERAASGALQWHAAVEATAGGKLAAVAASTVALAGGGALAAQDAARPARPSADRSAAVSGSQRHAPQRIRTGRSSGAAPPPARQPATVVPETGRAGPGGTTALRPAGARRKARSAAPGSPGAREFRVDPVGSSPAANEFPEASKSRRKVAGAAARATAHRSAVTVAGARTMSVSTDFPATPTRRAASRSAASRPAPASPAPSEFGR